jgi:uncharacterized surface protein with fasciclin (FAS1) repeats
MIQKTLLSFGLVLAASVGFAACSLNPARQINDNMMVETDSMMEGYANDGMTEAQPTMNIVELAQASGSFSTLLAAAEAAGLVEALSAAEVTIFAPTDEAFAALPAGTVDGLLADVEKLSAVLQYHVLPGTVTATELLAMPTATTLLGEALQVSTDGAGVMVNDATVLQSDVMATNGVIHVIDTVLMPAMAN